MIPKIIHYCWLSGDPVPQNLQDYMATWKAKLPDYEFILWDRNRFDLHSSEWVRQAFEARKYAFAADYIRLYAVYHYGGIYMDMDIEVVKPFDELLDSPYFSATKRKTASRPASSGRKSTTPSSNSAWTTTTTGSSSTHRDACASRPCPKSCTACCRPTTVSRNGPP